jgi:hypothetical protein
MASRLCICFLFFLFFGACKPAVEGSSEVQAWVTTTSFWNKKQGLVELYEFSCVTEKNENGRSKYGSYGGGCGPDPDDRTKDCNDKSVKDTVKNGVPKSVTLNTQKTIRKVTCDYIQYAYDNFQDSYASGKCSAWFSFSLFYKDTASTSSDNNDIFVKASPSVGNYGPDLKKALIADINSYLDKGEAKLTCN